MWFFEYRFLCPHFQRINHCRIRTTTITVLDSAKRINFDLDCASKKVVLWSQPDKATAENHLQDWIDPAEASGIKMLKDFANTLRTHRRGIIAYYDHNISTGPLEGTNNKIKTLQRQAYGFRDRAFFMLHIYALHTTRYELIG